jgi:hypothetical protein
MNGLPGAASERIRGGLGDAAGRLKIRRWDDGV